MHVVMGNYFYLTQLQTEPHVVSNFLKKVLKYMGEPLCTYKLYSRFRDLQDIPKPGDRKQRLKEICEELPLINRNVFVFIIRFFTKVAAQSDFNRMNLHNLATVITPNLFRPFDLTANDLIFAQHLVETLKVIITEYEYIFNVQKGGDQN